MRLAAVAFLVLAAAAGTSAPSPSASRVSAWRPRGVSSPAFESHAAFDPSNGDLYFVRSSKQFKGWRILTSHCDGERWSEPVPAPRS